MFNLKYSLWLTLPVMFAVVGNTLSTSMINTHKYKLIGEQKIATGATVVGAAFSSSSALRCSGNCNSLAHACQGFIFESDVCHVSGDKSSGSCQLIAFDDLTAVAMSSATTRCQQLFVADPCWKENPCKNQGACRVSDWPRICQCQRGYEGIYCETNQTNTTTVHSTVTPSSVPSKPGL
jgi:hypothetical protein